MSEFVVRKKVTLNASPLMVWRALTNPEMTKKYFFHCEVHSDWKKGSPITFKGKVFLIKNIELKGMIVKAEPGKLLKYTLQNGQGESESTITDRLTYEKGQTILSISDDVGKGKGAEERYKKSVKGWDKVLKGLKEVLEEH
jgi:uncharacterized protein YndB with AHSA1/START domain